MLGISAADAVALHAINATTTSLLHIVLFPLLRTVPRGTLKRQDSSDASKRLCNCSRSAADWRKSVRRWRLYRHSASNSATLSGALNR